MAGRLAVAGAGRGVRARGDLVVATALLEFQSPTTELIARPVPLRGRVTTWVVFAMVASVLAVAGVMPVDRVVTANGRVISRAGTLVVQPLETSIVRSILVQGGQVVHAGQTLARLDPTFTAADVGTYQAQATSLAAEVDRLRDEVADKPYASDGTTESRFQATIYGQRKAEYYFKLSNYREKIASLQSAVVRALGDVKAYTARLEGADVAAREVVPVALKTLEKKANVARFDRDALAVGAGAALAHRPAALVDQPVDEGADGVGERALHGVRSDLAPLAVGPRDGERDHGGLLGDLVAVVLEGHVASLR